MTSMKAKNTEYAIGIDLGGTKIETDIVSSEGEIVYRSRFATEGKRPKDEILKTIAQSVDLAKRWAIAREKKLKGVGIGAPGFVLPGGKMSLIANIPPFEGIDLRAELHRRVRMEIRVENDANCFAFAEHLYGAAKGTRDSIGLIWGTGVGSGIIIGNKIHSGFRGSAGEIGHVVINPDGPLRCTNCGAIGDIESYSSAPSIVRYYHRFGGENKEADPTFVMKSTEKAAEMAREQAIHYLSRGIAMLINILNPEAVVMGGGVSNSNHYRRINELTSSFTAPSIRKTCKVVRHKIGDSAGVIGAAALFNHETP